LKTDRTSTIAGQPLKTVRAMLRELGRSDYFTGTSVEAFLHKQLWSDHVDDLAKQGKVSPDMQLLYKKSGEWTNSSPNVHPLIGINRISDQATAARALVEQLLKDGMIELNARFSDCRGHVAYQPTSKGNAMRSARLVPRLNRAKADKLLADFLRSVEEVNAHPDLLHWVTEVRVFGSYLTNSDDLGNIDIAIRKEKRPVSGAFSDACVAMAEQNSKIFGTDRSTVFYLDLLVARLLKGGSRYISLHGVTELDENFDFEGKTIYTFAPPKRT
jgi:hypothetical protein